VVTAKINSQFSESASPLHKGIVFLEQIAEVFSVIKYPVNRELPADEYA
jgi:hypothetical protein